MTMIWTDTFIDNEDEVRVYISEREDSAYPLVAAFGSGGRTSRLFLTFATAQALADKLNAFLKVPA